MAARGQRAGHADSRGARPAGECQTQPAAQGLAPGCGAADPARSQPQRRARFPGLHRGAGGKAGRTGGKARALTSRVR